MGFITALASALAISVATATSIVVAVVSAVISMVLGMIMSPSGGGGNSAPKDQGVKQRLPTDPKNKLGIIYGSRKMAGQITFADISSDDQNMFFIISLAEGPCESVTDVFWADRKLSFSGDINTGLRDVTNAVSDNGEGESNDFLNEGRCRVQAFPQGGRCGPMEQKSARWRNNSGTRTMPNTAYAYIEITYDRDKKVTGLEQKIFWYVEGRRVRTFDNSGNLSTAVTYSKNPSECLVDYLTNPIFGCNIPDQDLDLPSFFRHKKFCGEMLTFTDSQTNGGGSGTAPRYDLNGTLNPDTELDINISELVTNGGGWFTYNLGKFGIISDATVSKLASDTVTTDNNKDGITIGRQYIISDIGANGTFTDFGAPATPTVGDVFIATRSSTASDSTFTGMAEEIVGVFSEKNMYGSLNITSGGFENIVNRLTIKYPSEDQAQQEEDQLVIDTRDSDNPFFIDPDSSNLVNADEPLLEKTIGMVLTRDNVQAQRIGAININNSRQTITTEFRVDLTHISLQAGDVIGIRHTTPGWGYDGTDFDVQNPVEVAPKLFRVVYIEEEIIENNIHLNVNAQEYANANYEDLTIQRRDAAPNTNFPSPNRQPDIGSINVRSKVQEYSFQETTLSSIPFTVTAGIDVQANNLVVGRTYIISSLGNTTQADWNTLAGTTGDTYTVEGTGTDKNTLTAAVSNVTTTAAATTVVAGRAYTIVSEAGTTQAEWNRLAGTLGANYVNGSTFTASESGTASSGTGTVSSDAGTGMVNEFAVTTISIGTMTPQGVATAVAAGLSGNALVTSSVVDSRIDDTVLVGFNGARAGDAILSGADTVSGGVRTTFDNATLRAEDNGVSSVVNGIPVSGLSVYYRDSDPFLDRVEIRWFNSSDNSISMDPGAGTAYIGNDLFQINGRSVRGEQLIGNALTTNNSPFEILELNPESTYQIDVRGLSYLGSKSDFIRLPAANTDSLASLYTALLTLPTTSVQADGGNAGTFNVGGEFQVFAGNTKVVSNIFYRITSVSRLDASSTTINTAGVYQATSFDSDNLNNSNPGEVIFRANVTDTTNVSVLNLESGTNYVITDVGTTSTAQWIQAGFPAGVIPTVGREFTATGITTGTGTAAKALITLDRSFVVEKSVDADSLLRMEVIHELESSPASADYVVGPNFFRDNVEYTANAVAQDQDAIVSGHNYTITSIGSGTVALAQARWNELAGTLSSRDTGTDPFIVGEEFFAIINGDQASTTAPTTLGSALTSERNYRLRAALFRGSSLDPQRAGYEYTWYKKDRNSAEVAVSNGIGNFTLEINANEVEDGEEAAYRVVVDTTPDGTQGSGGQTFNASGTLNSGLL